MRIRKKITVQLNGTTFFIPDERSYQKLQSKGFGYKISKDSYGLLPYEAFYLHEQGKIEVHQGKHLLDTSNLFKKRDIDCNEYLVFRDLVGKGFKVKSGLKYGFSFRVYEKDRRKYHREHAKWLVRVLDDHESVSCREIAQAGRIAHSTKKNVLLAVVDSEKNITYFQYEWTKL